MLEERSQFVQKTVKTGISFGSALAMVIAIPRGILLAGQFSTGFLVGCMSYIFGLFIPDGSTKGRFKRSGLLFI